MRSVRRAPLAVAVGIGLANAVLAQGPFVNYEDPQVKPIAVVRLQDPAADRYLEYVLACNTPDNSVEIYRGESPFTFIARVPVGLSPVTVRTRGGGEESTAFFYTCNYLGDSVTTVKLDWVAGTPAAVLATVERTTYVGDEPTDIAFFENPTPTCMVTLHSRSGVTMRNTSDMSIISGAVPLASTPSGSTVTDAVKAPRVAQTLSDGRFYCLNTMSTDLGYDFDLYAYHPVPNVAYRVPGIGTTNLNFTINSTGTHMFVVDQRAQNANAVGELAVSLLPTGFVQSWLHVVDLTTNGPTVHAEAPAATTPCPTFLSINLNRDYTASSLTPVTSTLALAQPTDVALLESGGGAVSRVVLSAFGSDKVAILTPDGTLAGGWQIQRVAMPLVSTTQNYGASGPRGLAVGTAADPNTPTTPGLVFCLNRLDNSLAVINPWTASVIYQTALQSDPTPAVIRAGRRFLYSAEFSGNKMVACASCHVDGRTDNNVWHLGDAATGPAIAANFHDGDGMTLTTMPNFPADKGLMTTQTLQGLVNHHVPELDMQSLAFTNAPYHWRGDRGDFESFNVAFVALQGMTNLGTTPPTGISTANMTAYRAFIDTIHHPPNPEQPITREYTGSIGDDPAYYNDPLVGTGGRLGLKLFTIAGLAGCNGRSCVQCHALGSGSNRRATEVFAPVSMISGTPIGDLHPFETAALRNLFQRERVLVSGLAATNDTTYTRTADTGLTNAGGLDIFVLKQERSINDFVRRIFEATLPGTSTQQATGAAALVEFVRGFDTGTAPMVGLAITLVPNATTGNNALCALIEAQVVEANVGLAVYTRTSGTVKGYWFDATVSPPQYREEGTGNLISRSTLIGLANPTGDVVILQATPVGSERRVASISGTATVLSGSAPSNVQLLPMVPNTAFEDVPFYTANWDPAGTVPFNWTGTTATPVSLASMRYFQTVLAAAGLVPGLRHEPTRRFRVSGDDIRPGARLELGMATTTAGSTPVMTVTLDLHPTTYLSAEEEMQVWETTEELDMFETLAWLCGGYFADGVGEVIQGTIPPVTPINLAWNSYRVRILNEDGTSSTAVWQQLTIADMR